MHNNSLVVTLLVTYFFTSEHFYLFTTRAASSPTVEERIEALSPTLRTIHEACAILTWGVLSYTSFRHEMKIIDDQYHVKYRYRLRLEVCRYCTTVLTKDQALEIIESKEQNKFQLKKHEILFLNFNDHSPRDKLHDEITDQDKVIIHFLEAKEVKKETVQEKNEQTGNKEEIKAWIVIAIIATSLVIFLIFTIKSLSLDKSQNNLKKKKKIRVN